MFQVPNDKIKHKNKIISEEEWPCITFGIPSPGFSKLMRCGGWEAHGDAGCSAQRCRAERAGARVWKIRERSLMRYESRWNEAVKSNNNPMDR
jgi:hypothetical protein